MRKWEVFALDKTKNASKDSPKSCLISYLQLNSHSLAKIPEEFISLNINFITYRKELKMHGLATTQDCCKDQMR